MLANKKKWLKLSMEENSSVYKSGLGVAGEHACSIGPHSIWIISVVSSSVSKMIWSLLWKGPGLCYVAIGTRHRMYRCRGNKHVTHCEAISSPYQLPAWSRTFFPFVWLSGRHDSVVVKVGSGSPGNPWKGFRGSPAKWQLMQFHYNFINYKLFPNRQFIIMIIVSTDLDTLTTL